MRIRRDILALIGLFVALAAFVGLAPRGDDQGQDTPTSHASGAGGALALYRWLGSLGYQVERLEYRDFALDPALDLLVVLAPDSRYSPEEAAAVLAWVEAGGTLLLADDRPGRFAGGDALLQAMSASIDAAPAGARARAPLLQPALGRPAADTVPAASAAMLGALPAGAALLVGPEAAPLLAGIQRGRGYIYLSAALHPFTNAGVGQPGGAALLLGLLRRIPAGGRVAFDEIHHGFVSEPSLRSLLLGNAWGWAVLYALLVGAAYVVASGRRFGRAEPLREERARRSSAEYLESMAGLLRRGRKGDYVGAHYRAALKRRLARPHGISPALDDDAFVAALAAARPLDRAALRALLARLSRSGLSEAELLRLVAEGDALL
jgi:hypothetical protein